MSENRLSAGIGILIFFIALVVYTLTLEPTNSFWDCSEFIACAYNLEIGHAPGAPVFMLLGKIFSLFAGGDVTKVAFAINMLSAMASALTVMFLFWIICWFSKKIILKSENQYNFKNKQLLIFGASAIGALSFAFIDSFWFSAVEAEVYATSSLFSAIVFWAILKWEESGSGYESTRWIVLIFYLLGLSVGIHLLNTLTLPAMALIFYYKNYKPGFKGFSLTILVSFLMILIIIFGIIPGIAGMAAYSDLFFVNDLKLPVYTGVIFFVVSLSALLYFTYQRSLKWKSKWISTVIVAFSFWLIGYSSFTLLVIRSNANPFIDMNNVENIFGLVDYLNREQYPKRPLIYGNNYNSPVVDVKKRYTYKLYDGKYYKDELNPEYVYNNQTLSLFPRMASNDPDHEKAYQNWIKIKGRSVDIVQEDGTIKKILVPTFFDNIHFFLKYQLGHMYFRYFMWNFVGRQNDVQGRGSNLYGNWMSGIKFIDRLFIADEKNRPETDNYKKSRNVYYFLPLILGLIGLFFQYKKDRSNFLVVLLLFILTGIAIVVYLNEIPITPRERDYAYVGSYFAFSIWMGLGCLAIFTKIKYIRENKILGLLTLTVLFTLVPLKLFIENYDDHNRSNRHTARDYAKNMLNSCEKNAIVFTTADNDTYPIWYLQEVEGHRTDVRQILQPFIAMDWYANQLRLSYNQREGVDLSFKGTDLLMSRNRYFPIINKIDSAIDLAEAIKFIISKDPRTQVSTRDNEVLDYLPGNKLTMNVNKVNFSASCSYCNLSEDEIPEKIDFELPNRYLSRDEMLILDILAHNDWERPLYFVNENLLQSLGLSSYLYREGVMFRLLPFKNKLPEKLEHAQVLYQYKKVKDEFKWGNVNQSNVYLDYMNIQIVSMLRFREMFSEIANTLGNLGEKAKAIEILDLGMQLFPAERIPYSFFIPEMVEAYYISGAKNKGDELANEAGNFLNEELVYFESIKKQGQFNSISNEAGKDMYILQELVKITAVYSTETYNILNEIFERNYAILN
ncbi:MAG: DUF2723 domain-containing protein [Bacteroidales bacterium]|nr:DUF2723 domain-containing protein [Bacteroidales bacterium]